MRLLRRIAAVALGPGLLFGLVYVGFHASDALVFGNCDAKFGCAGGIQLAMFIAGLVLALSSAGQLIACVIFRDTLSAMMPRWLVGVTLALALGQAALFFSATRIWWPAEGVTAMMAWWAVASAIFGLVVLVIARRWAPNNSFKGMPLRGTP